jgi:hypothetical protein
MMQQCDIDSSDSLCGSMTGSFKHSNEPSDSVKDVERLLASQK